MGERTQLQSDANRIDCNLYRVISAIENLADEHERHKSALLSMAATLQVERVTLRMLMHAEDLEGTR